MHPLALYGASLNYDRDVYVVGGIPYRRSFAYEKENKHQFKYIGDGSVVRFETRDGDIGDASNLVSGNERSEIVPINPLTPGQPGTIFQFEEDGWISYSLRLDNPTTAEFSILGQFHDFPEPEDVHMSPPLSFVAYPSSVRPDGTVKIPFAMATLFDPNFSSPIANPNYRTRYSGELTMKKWVNIVLHFRASIKGTGALELWIDGVKVCDLQNISFGFNNATGFAYWQWGIYRKKDPNTLVAYYANMEYGRANLSARILNPKPIINVDRF